MNNDIKHYFLYNFFLVLIFLIPACGWGAKTKISEKRSGLIIVDVNDEVSFKDAHIKTALNLPYEKIALDSKFLDHNIGNWDKNSFIVVYCIDYACSASHIVAKKLKDLGFNNVNVYTGGIQEWYQLAQKNKNAYPYEGAGLATVLNKEINKIENIGEAISVIGAEELSKQINKKNGAA